MLKQLPTFTVIYLYLIAAGFGLIMGSALNCLAGRIVSGQKWAGNERSACPACGHTLSARDLGPLFSWLSLKGKCRYCGAKVSARYPLTEALLALCYISLLWASGLSVHTLSLVVLCSCLFCLSLVDLDIQIIPHRFLVIPAVVRIAELLYEGGCSALLAPVLTGLGLGGSVLVLSLIMDKVLKKDTMGGGDIKLLALLGLYFTVPQCFLMLILACILGIVIAALLMRKKSDAAFPFGPALSLGAWITLLIGEPLISWYLTLFL